MIGNIPPGDHAERFSDYLLAQNIDNMVEESASGDWSVWVEHDDDLDRGKVELSGFLANPSDPKFDAAGKAKRIRADGEKKQKRLQRKYIDVRTRWGQASQWAAPVTLTLIAISALAGIGTRFGAQMTPIGNYLTFVSFDKASIQERLERIVRENPEMTSPSELMKQVRQTNDGLADIRRGQIWRVITPIFLHFSILHLVFNMFWLRDLGGMIETQRGTWVLLALVLVTATLSNVGQYVYQETTDDFAMFGGMSGVNYALFGYIWVKSRFQPHLGLGVNEQTTMILIAWLFICMTGWVGPVANAAHVIGLLAGGAFAYAPYLFHRLSRMGR
jgi:GlpG protein